MDTHQKIRDYVAKNLLYSNNGFEYDDDDSFLQHGIIDSVGVMDLILFIEENYDFEVEDSEITPDNFDSVNNLATYIQSKVAIPV